MTSVSSGIFAEIADIEAEEWTSARADEAHADIEEEKLTSTWADEAQDITDVLLQADEAIEAHQTLPLTHPRISANSMARLHSHYFIDTKFGKDV